MYQVIQKIYMPEDHKQLKAHLEDLLKQFPHAEFYAKAMHENDDYEDEQLVEGRVLLQFDGAFVIHDNPWEDDSDGYYANFWDGENAYTWFVDRDYKSKGGYGSMGFLWIAIGEVFHMEMRYTPASNKEAVGALERYDSG